MPVDPTKIKRASKLTRTVNTPNISNRVEDTSGYHTPPVTSKGFATYRKLLSPGATDELVMHPKKTRVYHVVAGQGAIVFKHFEGETGTKRLVVGETFECPPGMEYRCCTFGTSFVEFIVVEDSKYQANLVVKAEATAGGALPESVVMGTTPVGRRGTNAKTQAQVRQAQLAKARHQGDAVAVEAIASEGKAQPFAIDINPSPDSLLPPH